MRLGGKRHLGVGAAVASVVVGAAVARGAETSTPTEASAPETVLTGGPARVTFERRPVFRFRSEPAGASFRCQVDGGSFRPCASPFRPQRLSPGRHRVRVRAVSPEGIGDPTPAARRFVVAKRTVRFGRSVRGRELRARRSGNPAARRTVLVVGSIHGDETAGHGVVSRLPDRARLLRRVDLWVVRSVNPDGARSRTRTNARGVDLNRNFSVGWRAGPRGPAYSGPRPFSEPESRAVERLIRRIRPRVTIWYHQPWGQVLAPCSGGARLERLYSRVSRLPLERCRGEDLPGTATRWQERIVGGRAFVVEFGPGRLTSSAERRHARAALAVARPQR